MIKVEIIDLEKVLAKLIELPEEIADRAVEDVNDYMLHVEQGYPPYRHITYKSAYGGWKSEKQRRYVMWKIREKEIVPGQQNRSQKYSQAWKKVGEGRNQYLQNSSPYGLHLQSENQARMMGMIGWKKISEQLRERAGKINQIIDAAVKKALKRRKL